MENDLNSRLWRHNHFQFSIFHFQLLSSVSSINWNLKNTAKQKAPLRAVLFNATQVCKPGSVLTAIYLVPQLLTGSSRLLGAVGSTHMLLHGVAPDRVYIVKPVSLQAGWALTPPFHPCLAAVYLCCTCPGVTPGGRYPLSLPCGARTFLT